MALSSPSLTEKWVPGNALTRRSLGGADGASGRPPIAHRPAFAKVHISEIANLLLLNGGAVYPAVIQAPVRIRNLGYNRLG